MMKLCTIYILKLLLKVLKVAWNPLCKSSLAQILLATENLRWQKLRLVSFYGISTIVGFLILNPVYSYAKYVICKHFLNVLKRT